VQDVDRVPGESVAIEAQQEAPAHPHVHDVGVVYVPDGHVALA